MAYTYMPRGRIGGLEELRSTLNTFDFRNQTPEQVARNPCLEGQIVIGVDDCTVQNFLEFRPIDQTVNCESDLVTCCIPFGNDHSYLNDAIGSVMKQTTKPCKILVGVDSAGESKLSCDLPSCVEVYHAPRHVGPFSIMDTLIRMAETEYILVLDSDDLSHPYRLQLLLASAEDARLDIVGSAVTYFSETSNAISALGIFPTFPLQALRTGMCHAVLYPSCLFRRKMYIDVGGFSDFDYFGMDTEFILRTVSHGNSLNVSSPLYLKRIRATSLTRSPDTGMVSARRRRIMRFTAAKHLALFG